MTVQYLLGNLPFVTGGVIAMAALSACSSPASAPPSRIDTPVKPHVSAALPTLPPSAPTANASNTPSPPAPPVSSDARQAMIQQLSAAGIDAAWTRQQLAQARYSESARRLMLPPASPSVRSWPRYRARFLDTQRINEGVAFAKRH